MKKSWITKMAAVLCLAMGITLIPANQLSVQAAEVIATVEGTVLSETTQELLHLSTKDGKMEIKLDSNTDASGCKLLLTGEKISVSVSHGSDGYLHAVKISSDVKTPGIPRSLWKLSRAREIWPCRMATSKWSSCTCCWHCWNRRVD